MVGESKVCGVNVVVIDDAYAQPVTLTSKEKLNAGRIVIDVGLLVSPGYVLFDKD